MKKIFYILGTTFIVVVAIGTIQTYFKFHYPITDCISRSILYPLEDTEWTKGIYDDNNFLKVKIGMTKTEVLKLLGPPAFGGDPSVNNNSDTGKFWHYTKALSPIGSMTWHKRRVVFDDKGLVSEINREFYID